MNISKALKAKNSLVKDISTLSSKIQQYNSSIVGSENPYNTKNLLTELDTKTKELIALKTALNIANAPIQPSIYEISELKSMVSRLKSIGTQSGKSLSHRFHGESAPIEYVAQITTLELEDIIKGRELEIEALQEKIDTFNYTTQI